MTLTIELPDEQREALAIKARAEGLSAEQFARQVLVEAIGSSPRRRHISDVIRENMREVPSEMLGAIPPDAASEHDHYIYGLPKKNQ